MKLKSPSCISKPQIHQFAVKCNETQGPIISRGGAGGLHAALASAVRNITGGSKHQWLAERPVSVLGLRAGKTLGRSAKWYVLLPGSGKVGESRKGKRNGKIGLSYLKPLPGLQGPASVSYAILYSGYTSE